MGEMSVDKLLSVLLVLFMLVIILLPGGTAAAQGEIEVSDNQAVLRFPDSVTFTIDVIAAAEVRDVFLTYGTNARSCQDGGSRQSIDFDPGTEVQAEWEWELKRSGSMPPGSVIWWTWTVEDTDGRTFTTERQELLVNDERHNWRSVEREGVTVNWFSGDGAFAEEVMTTAISDLERLSTEIGVDAPEEVQLWLYPTADELRDALVISAEWTGAVAFTDYQIMVFSLAPGQSGWAAEVIPHELTHLVVGTATHNCRGGYLPVWLSEGLAVYGEGSIDASDFEQLERALQEERLPSLRALADGFSAYGGGAHLAYTQSGEVVRFMLEQYGPEQMDALLSAIRDGLTIDRALEQVLGFDTDELDARWRLGVGYAATPTSAAAQALAEATPTAVPTLSLVGPVVAFTPSATPEPPTVTPRPSPTTTEPAPSPVEPDPTQTATSSPAAEVAAGENPKSTPRPAPLAEAANAETDPSPLPWIAAIGLGVAVFLVAGYFVLRKGE
jgi:hypothetical protein